MVFVLVGFEGRLMGKARFVCGSDGGGGYLCVIDGEEDRTLCEKNICA